MSFGSLPPIDASRLPADIRTASPARQQAYRAALGFEQLLVQQLTSSLADSAQGTFGGGGDSADGGGQSNPYASLLPDALTQGVMGGGGLGLAAQLTDVIDPQQRQQPAPQAPADAGGAGA
jgi:Rod binding domain-containing protein